MRRPDRRAVLVTLATVGLAGCLDSGDDSPEPELDDSTGASDQHPTDDEPTDDEPTDDEQTDRPPADDEQADQAPTDDESTDDEPTDQPPADDEPTDDEPTDDGVDDSPSDEDIFPGYEMTTVGVRSSDGELLGSVRAAIADAPQLRYTGLSETDHLPETHGMLFVFDEVDDRTFVMREMDFGIDIVYADDEGRITEIHHAPEPGPDEDGAAQSYPGRGQYVLEVTYRWTADRDVEDGGYLEFDL